MGDRPYFVVGNVWLLTALILMLGQKMAPHYGGRYAFFGVGGALSPQAYWFLIVVCLCLGVGLMCSRKRP